MIGCLKRIDVTILGGIVVPVTSRVRCFGLFVASLMSLVACSGQGTGNEQDASTDPADAARPVAGQSGSGGPRGGGGVGGRDAGASSAPDGFPSVIPEDEQSEHCNDLARIDSYVVPDKQPTARAPAVGSFVGGAIQDGTYEMVTSRVFVDGGDASSQYVVSRTLKIFDVATKLILVQVFSPPPKMGRINLALTRVSANRIDAMVVCGSPTDIYEYAYDATPAGSLRMGRLGRDGKIQFLFEYRRVGD